MTRRVLYVTAVALSFCIWRGVAYAQLPEPSPKLHYEAIADFFQLPLGEHLVERAPRAFHCHESVTCTWVQDHWQCVDLHLKWTMEIAAKKLGSKADAKDSGNFVRCFAGSTCGLVSSCDRPNTGDGFRAPGGRSEHGEQPGW